MKNSELKLAIKQIAVGMKEIAGERGLNYIVELGRINRKASKVVKNIALHSDKARSNYTKAEMREAIIALQELAQQFK